MDLDLFYASTTITIGNDACAPFWYSPWLHGKKLKDIAPLIYMASLWKKWKVREALADDAWILKINRKEINSMQHLQEFYSLRVLLHDTHLREDVEDDLV